MNPIINPGLDKTVRRTLMGVVIGFVILALIFRWTNHGLKGVVASDGRGYYAYLPALFTYHDLSYSYFFDGTLNLPAEYTRDFLFNIDGHYVDKYPPGAAILLIPFYLMALLITALFGMSTSGYSAIFQLSVAVGAIFYAFLGLKWISSLLSRYKVHAFLQAITLAALAFGTNLTNYAINEPSMSHVYSFAMMALFMLEFRRWLDTGRPAGIYRTGLALGIIVLLRPVNAVVVVAAMALIGDAEGWRQFFRRIAAMKFKLLVAVFLFSAVVFIQPLLWYLQNGHWYNWTYLGESFNWGDPQMMSVLFSYKKGWFVYTPFMLMLFPSICALVLERRWLDLASTLFFWALLLYVVSSWWCWYYGGSFSQRVFIDFYPVAAFSFIPLLARMQRPVHTRLYFFFVFLCIILNLIQSYQYKRNILHWDSMNKEKYWKVFLKISPKYEWMVFVNENFNTPAELEGKVSRSFTNDFEGCPSEWASCRFEFSSEALSGNNVLTLTPETSYSSTLKFSTDMLIGNSFVEVRYWSQGTGIEGTTEVVLSIDDTSNNNVYRQSYPVCKSLESRDGWFLYSNRFSLEGLEKFAPGTVNVYFFASGTKSKLLVDDLMVMLVR